MFTVTLTYLLAFHSSPQIFEEKRDCHSLSLFTCLASISYLESSFLTAHGFPPLVKGNKDPGYEGGLASQVHPKFCMCGIEARTQENAQDCTN